MMRRRELMKAALVAASGRRWWPGLAGKAVLPFKISLAQWSLRRTFFGPSLDLPWERRQELFRSDPDALLQGDQRALDFPVIARKQFGLSGVEYVNTFMYGRADDERWLAELMTRAEGEGVTSVLIMCDLEGALGDPDSSLRAQAIENHVRWLRAATRLGCHAIRVNAQSRGTDTEQAALAADGLRRLAERAEEFRLHVLVENHGGLSSRGSWLMDVLRAADHPLLGTLPDFGNFTVSTTERYDAYRGVSEMMPLARAVSAKSYDFDAAGNEVRVDFLRMMRIVNDAGYRDWIGVEYEGSGLPEPEGIRATVRLLEKVGAELER